MTELATGTLADAGQVSGASAAESLLELIGNTPLLRLRPFEQGLGAVEIYAKAEWKNPGGSVKDRAAWRMIRDAEADGRLVPGGRTVLDATSGNTGIAYAMIGAARGYAVRLCLPANASPERQRILRAYGADIVLTSPLEGTDGAIREARRLYAADPDRYFYPDQYNNDSNWRAHYDTTGPEIIRQTGGRVTHFVAGLGTGGTFTGVGRRLRDWNPRIQLVSFQPDSPFHGLEGLKHMETAIVPGIYDPALADRDLGVGTEEAYRLVRRLAREAGLLVGISSGAALAASLQVARELHGRPAVIVTVFPDGAEKYLTDRLWDEDGAGAREATDV
ncbi:MAG: cysteine synthase family protein [Acidobacteriota bacterium]|nr:cysteine synthase family protein [Acidobacteriota bacterium]